MREIRKEKIDETTLEQLMVAGLEENQRFFRSNEKLREVYRDNLVAVCLCGEAAKHFIDSESGVSLFEVWMFYQRDERLMFPHQNIRKRDFEYDPFVGLPVEFYKRTVPRKLLESGVEKGIISYLNGKESRLRSSIKSYPIIGIYPDDVFGKNLLASLAPSVGDGDS